MPGLPIPAAHAKRGFTLVEVLAAAAILIMAIASSLTTLTYGLRSIDNARYTTLAGQILQSQMEKLRLLTWSQLTDTTTGPVASTTFTTDISSVSSAQLSRFTCTQSITNAEAPFASTMRKIELTAAWNGIDGRAHSLKYISYYGQNGISDFFYTTH